MNDLSLYELDYALKYENIDHIMTLRPENSTIKIKYQGHTIAVITQSEDGSLLSAGSPMTVSTILQKVKEKIKFEKENELWRKQWQ